MTQTALKKVDWFVAGSGLLLSLGAFFLFGREAGIGTCVGAIVATANWVGFRWAGIRMAATGDQRRFGIFLAFKTVILLPIIVLLLTVMHIPPIPFMAGMSALVLGIVARGTIQAIEEGEDALKKED